MRIHRLAKRSRPPIYQSVDKWAVMKTDIAIIGAGLTGLSAARRLTAQGVDALILEGRDRVGGRAFSIDGYDVGPAWIWPGQPLIAELLGDLGLASFDQHVAGRMIYEDEQGRVRRDLDMAMMGGAWRIAGGLSAVTKALADGASDGAIRLGAAVRTLAIDGDHVRIAIEGADDVLARRVILATPPRLAAATIRLAPEPPKTLALWRSVPTWMAGHAKLVAVYGAPFWRDAGFSGEAMSRRGPLAEIHDASPIDADAGALFGFIGAPPALRANAAFDLQSQAIDQLVRLFGDKAARPDRVIIQDWVREPLTATAEDHTPPPGHPPYQPLPQPDGQWTDRLFLASAETAPVNGGLIEGALEAAAMAVDAIV